MTEEHTISAELLEVDSEVGWLEMVAVVVGAGLLVTPIYTVLQIVGVPAVDSFAIQLRDDTFLRTYSLMNMMLRTLA